MTKYNYVFPVSEMAWAVISILLYRSVIASNAELNFDKNLSVPVFMLSQLITGIQGLMELFARQPHVVS